MEDTKITLDREEADALHSGIVSTVSEILYIRQLDCEKISICYDYIDNRKTKLEKKYKRSILHSTKTKLVSEITSLDFIRRTISQYVCEHKEHFEALF